MKNLNIAIIGCGRVAGHHVKAIEKNKDLILHSVCDFNNEILQNFKVGEKVRKYLNYNQDYFVLYNNYKLFHLLLLYGYYLLNMILLYIL